MHRVSAGRATLALVVVLAFAGAAAASSVLLRPDAAGSAAGAPGRLSVGFKPDRRTPQACRAGDLACLRQAYGNIAYRDGGAAALAQLKLAFERDAELELGCHSVAHFVGFGALLHHRGKVGATLAEGTSACSSGYYHGVLTMAFDGARESELGAIAAPLCVDPQLSATPTALGQCVHGVGHGLMLISSYDLPTSLRICDAQPQNSRQACFGGVFMENHAPSFDSHTKWLRANEPEYPCNAIADRYRDQCYVQLVGRVRDDGLSWKRTVELCLSVAKAWRETCVRSVGYSAESVSRGQSGPVLAACRFAGSLQGTCIAGAAHTRISFTQDGSGAARLCMDAPASLRAQCVHAVAESFTGLGRSPDEAARQCRDLFPRYARSCTAAG